MTQKHESLVQRIRLAMKSVPKVEEKSMFGGLTFMVDGKMCISVGKNGLMCRINPNMHEKAIQRSGCSTVVMRGRPYRGYVRVSEEALRNRRDFDYWVDLALRHNPIARASVRRTKVRRRLLKKHVVSR